MPTPVDQQRYRQLASEYRVSAIPPYVLLAPSGKVLRQWAGTTPERDFDNTMAKICAETP
ncbi:MAG: hypothetical protein R6W69_12145 [Anaerolineales bacterium]